MSPDTSSSTTTASDAVSSLEAERVERLDLRHLWRVLWRWRMLVAGGTVFVLAAAAAILQLTPPNFVAEHHVQVDQPGLLARGENGLSTAQKLINLTPTFARVVTSDPVLNGVRDRVETDATLESLRSRIESAPIPETTAVSIRATDGNEVVAEQLAAAAGAAFAEYLGGIQEEAEVPEAIRYEFMTLLEPQAERPGRNEARTLVLAALLGLFVMMGLAFLLEYIQEGGTEPSREREGDDEEEKEEKEDSGSRRKRRVVKVPEASSRTGR